MGYAEIKSYINTNIKTNGNQEITGAKMNSVLNDIMDYVYSCANVEDSLTKGTDYNATLFQDNAYMVHNNIKSSNYYAIYKIAGSKILWGYKYIFSNFPANSVGGVTYIAAYDEDDNYIGDVCHYTGVVGAANTQPLSFVADLTSLAFRNKFSYLLVTIYKTGFTDFNIARYRLNPKDMEIVYQTIDAPTLYQDGKFINRDGTLVSASGYHLWKLIPQNDPALYHIIASVNFGSELPVVYAYTNDGVPLLPMFSKSGVAVVEGDAFNYINGIKVGYFLICTYGNNTQPIAFEYSDNNASSFWGKSLFAVSKSVKTKDVIITTKVLASDGSGDYTTLKQVFDSITDADADHRYVIQIKEGTYDAFEGYSVTDASIGLVMPNYTTLVGAGDKRRIIIKGELANSATSSAKASNSTLNIEGNCTIRNITITGKNVRYCVHSDRVQGENTEIVVENCNFYHYGNFGNEGYSSICWGMGTWTNCRRIFRNCEFNSADDPGWITHDRNSGTDKPCYILLENCRFINRAAIQTDGEAKFCSMMIQSVGDNIDNVLEIVGCSGNLPVDIKPSFWDGGVNIGLDYHIIGHGNNVPIHFENTYRTDSRCEDRGSLSTFLGDEGGIMKNGTSSLIPVGTPVKLTDNATIAVATSKDDFYGITNQDIAAEGLGYVKTKGYFDISDLDGVSKSIGTKIGINDGKLVEVQSGELFVVKYYGYLTI